MLIINRASWVSFVYSSLPDNSGEDSKWEGRVSVSPIFLNGKNFSTCVVRRSHCALGRYELQAVSSEAPSFVQSNEAIAAFLSPREASSSCTDCEIRISPFVTERTGVCPLAPFPPWVMDQIVK